MTRKNTTNGFKNVEFFYTSKDPYFGEDEQKMKLLTYKNCNGDPVVHAKMLTSQARCAGDQKAFWRYQ